MWLFFENPSRKFNFIKIRQEQLVLFTWKPGYISLDGPGIKSRWGGEILRTCPDRPWGPPSLLYDGYRVFPGGKERPGRGLDPSPPSSVVVMKEYSYTSTPPLDLRGLLEGELYLLNMPSLLTLQILKFQLNVKETNKDKNILTADLFHTTR